MSWFKQWSEKRAAASAEELIIRALTMGRPQDLGSVVEELRMMDPQYVCNVILSLSSDPNYQKDNRTVRLLESLSSEVGCQSIPQADMANEGQPMMQELELE